MLKFKIKHFSMKLAFKTQICQQNNLMLIIEDPTVAVKCRTAIQVLFLYFEFKAKN
jgi:hypothetical protein